MTLRAVPRMSTKYILSASSALLGVALARGAGVYPLQQINIQIQDTVMYYIYETWKQREKEQVSFFWFKAWAHVNNLSTLNNNAFPSVFLPILYTSSSWNPKSISKQHDTIRAGSKRLKRELISMGVKNR